MNTIHEKMTAIGNAIREKTDNTKLLTLDEMAIEIANISTGVELNFEVVGGTSQPTNTIENTIWINTSTTISSWMFSDNTPSNPSSGMVWIVTSSIINNKFNSFKSNALYAYPIAAYQYSGSTWVRKTAKIYQNGTWKTLALTVVPNNTDYSSAKWNGYHTSSGSNPSISTSTTATSMTFNAWSGSNVSIAYVPIDVTAFKKLTIAGSYSVPNNKYDANMGLYIGMYKSVNGAMATGYSVGLNQPNVTVNISERSYDISSLTGTYYFCVHVINYARYSDWVRQPTVTLTKVLFE